MQALAREMKCGFGGSLPPSDFVGQLTPSDAMDQTTFGFLKLLEWWQRHMSTKK
jgi:hypothetical protein